jgi:hypothetical protein
MDFIFTISSYLYFNSLIACFELCFNCLMGVDLINSIFVGQFVVKEIEYGHF